MKTVQYTELTAREFQELIDSHFPKNGYEYEADEETLRDSSATYKISKEGCCKDWLGSNIQRFVNNISGKESSSCVYLFLEYFVFVDIIPEGNIIIRS